MVQRAPHASPNPSFRTSRWAQLWRPLLRLSLGFCLALSPFVFAACGILEGVSHAKGVGTQQQEDKEWNDFQARGGLLFLINIPPKLSPGALNRYVSQKIFGLTSEEDSALRQKDPLFPRIQMVSTVRRNRPVLLVNVTNSYYRHIVIDEKFNAPSDDNLRYAHAVCAGVLYPWSLARVTQRIAAERGNVIALLEGGKQYTHQWMLIKTIWDEICLLSLHEKTFSVPEEARIFSLPHGGGPLPDLVQETQDTPSKPKPSDSRAASVSRPASPHPHIVASDAERASYHLDGVVTAPAYPASIRGPGQLVAGASSVYTMILDTPGKLPEDEVYYSFALYNITSLVKKGLADQLTPEALAHNALTGGEEITLWAAKRRDLSRRLENLKTDTKTAAKGVIHPLTHGGPLREEVPAALINTASLYLTEASALVSLGGLVAGSFVDWVAGAEHERMVPAPTTPGYYLLRSIGTPRPFGQFRRASSLAIKIIEVRAPAYWAQEARDADERALLELALKEKTTQDPKALAEVKQQQQDLRAAAQQPLEQLLADQRATLLRQVEEQLREQMKQLTSPSPDPQIDYRTRLANVDARLRLVRKYNPKFQDITRTVRVKAGFASTETSLTVPLFLQLGRLPDAGDRPHYGLLDATVPDGDLYDATGATEEEAIWKVFAYFAGHAGYGRGSLAVTLPVTDKLPTLHEYSRVLDCHPTGTSLLKNRLQDLSIVLTLLSLPVSSIGGVALLLGGALSAVRLYDRFTHDTLKWDFEAVTDTLMVLGAASSAVGTLGKFVRVQGGTRFALAAQGTNVAQLTAVLQQVEKGMATLGQVIGVGGLVVGNLGMLKQLKQIEEQELAGTITHTEALQQRSDVLFQGLLTNVLFVKGLKSAPKEPLPGPAATLEELPPIEGKGQETPLSRKLTPLYEALLRRGPPTTPPGPPGLKDAPVPGPNKPTKKPGGTAQAPEAVEAQVPVVQEQVLAATGTDGAAPAQTEAQPAGKGTAPKRGAGLTVMDGGKTGAGGTGAGGASGGGTSGVSGTGTVAPARGSTGSTGTRGQAPKEIAPSSQGPALAPEGSSAAAGVAAPEPRPLPTEQAGLQEPVPPLPPAQEPGMLKKPVPGKPTMSPAEFAEALGVTGTDGTAQQTDGTATGTDSRKGAEPSVMAGGKTGAGGTGGGGTSGVSGTGTLAPAPGVTGTAGSPTATKAREIVPGRAQGPALAPEGVGPRAAPQELPEHGVATGSEELIPLRHPSKPIPTPEQILAWTKNFEETNTPKSHPRHLYEIKQTGSKNVVVEGGGERIAADGITETGYLQEAKFVGNPKKSPYIECSGCYDVARENAIGDLKNELRRYKAIIDDLSTPIVGLEIITNLQEARPFFENMLREYKIPGRVLVKP